MKKNWIKKAIKHPGALRKALKTKKDESITMEKLEHAAEMKGKMGKRARLAMTLRKISRG